jgi:kynurenine formamidase
MPPLSARAATSRSVAARARPPSARRRIVSLSGVTDLAALLAPAQLVDLTQPLGAETALWPGSRPFSATTVADYDTHGCFARELEVPEHAGTHLDAPAHFAPDGARVDAIPLGSLVRPVVKLDVRAWVNGDAAATISAAVVRELEERDGAVEPGTAVLVQTGWDAYCRQPARYLGSPTLAFPGLAGDAAELLVERRIAGLGIDTISVDPGNSSDLPVHWTTLPAGIWHLEGLVNLDRIPARGAWLVAAPLRLTDGSGAPARVFAILPPDD